MVRKPRLKLSTMLARTQPDVMQPVTITVSQRFFAKKAAAGVLKKIDGALLRST